LKKKSKNYFFDSKSSGTIFSIAAKVAVLLAGIIIANLSQIFAQK
jgi:hypothetical protein